MGASELAFAILVTIAALVTHAMLFLSTATLQQYLTHSRIDGSKPMWVGVVEVAVEEVEW